MHPSANSSSAPVFSPESKETEPACVPQTRDELLRAASQHFYEGLKALLDAYVARDAAPETAISSAAQILSFATRTPIPVEAKKPSAGATSGSRFSPVAMPPAETKPQTPPTSAPLTPIPAAASPHSIWGNPSQQAPAETKPVEIKPAIIPVASTAAPISSSKSGPVTRVEPKDDSVKTQSPIFLTPFTSDPQAKKNVKVTKAETNPPTPTPMIIPKIAETSESKSVSTASLFIAGNSDATKTPLRPLFQSPFSVAGSEQATPAELAAAISTESADSNSSPAPVVASPFTVKAPEKIETPVPAPVKSPFAVVVAEPESAQPKVAAQEQPAVSPASIFGSPISQVPAPTKPEQPAVPSTPAPSPFAVPVQETPAAPTGSKRADKVAVPSFFALAESKEGESNTSAQETPAFNPFTVAKPTGDASSLTEAKQPESAPVPPGSIFSRAVSMFSRGTAPAAQTPADTTPAPVERAVTPGAASLNPFAASSGSSKGKKKGANAPVSSPFRMTASTPIHEAGAGKTESPAES